jgi:hypothetical protein
MEDKYNIIGNINASTNIDLTFFSNFVLNFLLYGIKIIQYDKINHYIYINTSPTIYNDTANILLTNFEQYILISKTNIVKSISANTYTVDELKTFFIEISEKLIFVKNKFEIYFIQNRI